MGRTDVEKIISLCKKGDKKAQKTLFDLYAPRMMFICKRYFSSLEDSEDAFIEGFMKVFVALPNYNYIDEKNFNRWVRRIMINHCINTLKKNKRLILLEKQMQEEVIKTTLEERKDYSQNTFSQADILHCLNKLPENLKTVFNMLVIDEFSQKEVAQRLETSEGVVKVYAFRARQILKQKLYEMQNNRQNK